MRQKVALAFGGNSPEHEVSLRSASYVYNSLDMSLFEVLLLGNDKQGSWFCDLDYAKENIALEVEDYFSNATKVTIQVEEGKGVIVDCDTFKVLADFDVVFPIIQGSFGEDGRLQDYFSFLGIPSVRAGVLASAICIDKEITKRILRDKGIPITRFKILYQNNKEKLSFDDVKGEYGTLFFVKPRNSGSSFGVSKVSSLSEFKRLWI